MPACVYYDEGSKTTKVAIRNNGEYARDKYFIYIGGKQLMPIPTVRPPCPVCAAKGNERVWRGTNAGEGSFGFGATSTLKVLSKRHKTVGSIVKALVCTKCGYVQLFVAPEDFSD
jgi:hypothetical protein